MGVSDVFLALQVEGLGFSAWESRFTVYDAGLRVWGGFEGLRP